MTLWFLVSIATGQYLGPLPQDVCQHAAIAALLAQGIVCREATAMTMCPVPNQSNAYMACPVFDFPKVTVKP